MQQYGSLKAQICATRRQMGQEAARQAAECLRISLAGQEQIGCIFAAAPSQNEFLEELILQEGVDWKRVNVFHMDEYVGLSSSDARSFSSFLKNAVFDRLPFRSVHLLNGGAAPAEECARYAALIERMRPEFVFMGIGENGHIAFNDPPVADFEDPLLVKTVELEERCRRQQVNDGCFASLEQVPARALTLTVPALMACQHVFSIVPGARKAQAVKAALTGPVSAACPASILRYKMGARLYLDTDSAALLT